MKRLRHPHTLVLLISLLYIQLSCSKDSDLLAEYIVEESLEVSKESSSQTENDSTVGDSQSTGNPSSTGSSGPQDRNVGELKAFPTAEGYGKYATGGRGQAIFVVSNLNDSGQGSFRRAVDDADANNGGTIVFKTGGTVNLQSSIIIGSNGAQNITIAGETAPGDGFGVRMSSSATYGAAIEIRGSNVIIRHIRIHVGSGAHNNCDGLRIHNQWNTNGALLENVVADHLSVYWTTDEAIEIGSYHGGLVRNVSIQNCLIAEPLEEGYGPLVYRDITNSSRLSDVTFYANMFNGIHDRSPSGTVSGLNYEVINCIKYNVKNNTLVQYGNHVDYIGNIIKNAAVQPNLPYQRNVFNYDPNVYSEPTLDPNLGSVWDDDNLIFGDNTGNPMYNAGWSAHKASSRVNTNSLVSPMASSLVSDFVTANVGSNLHRNTIINDHDTRVINDYINGTGTRITNENQVGGHLTYEAGTAYTDADNDNMWDVAEIAIWGNINVINDPLGDENGDGYTNLEETFFYFTGE